jgi:hypothetical protein
MQLVKYSSGNLASIKLRGKGFQEPQQTIERESLQKEDIKN